MKNLIFILSVSLALVCCTTDIPAPNSPFEGEFFLHSNLLRNDQVIGVRNEVVNDTIFVRIDGELLGTLVISDTAVTVNSAALLTQFVTGQFWLESVDNKHFQIIMLNKNIWYYFERN